MIVRFFIKNIGSGMRVRRSHDKERDSDRGLELLAQVGQLRFPECPPQIKSHQGKALFTNLQDQYARIKRIQGSRGELPVFQTVKKTVHRQARRRSDISLGHTSAE